MATKLLLAGYYGFNNSGDDAILKSMVESLKNDKHPYEIVALSNEPNKTERDYGIDAVYRFSIKEVFSAMKETDIFVFGGGSLLQDVTSTRSLIYYLSLIRLAKMLGKKVFIFANGVGPINDDRNKKLTRRVLEKVDYISLRDNESLEYIKGLGVKNPNVEVTADPVFLLDAASDERIDMILRAERIKLSDRTLAISLRYWKDSKDLDKIFTEFCDVLAGLDMDILLVPMHYPYDLDYLRNIKNNTSNERVHLLTNKYQVEEIIGILGRCSISMAMRLHGVIYSAVAGIPTIALVYDPKVYGLAKELNIEEYINVEDISLEKLLDLLEKTIESMDDRKEEISKAGDRQKILSYKTLDKLRELALG